jgi:hypothetical protein
VVDGAFLLHGAPGHRILLATGQQIQQGALLQVGQDSAVAAVQLQLVDAQAVGCLEALKAARNSTFFLQISRKVFSMRPVV